MFLCLQRCFTALCRGLVPRGLAAGACLLAAPAGAHATVLEPLPAHYRVTDAWGVRKGLPDSFVSWLTIGPEGALWMGTRSGMARFNGRDVTPMAPFLAAPFSTSPFVFDVDGIGWVATVDGVGFTRTPEWMDVGMASSLRGLAMGGLAADGQGVVWVVAGDKLGRYPGGKLTWLTPPPGFLDSAYLSPTGLSAGGVLLLSENGIFTSRDGVEWESLGRPPHMTSAAWFMAREAPTGDIWLSWVEQSEHTSHVARWTRGQWELAPPDALSPTGRVCCFAPGLDGTWLAGTDRGWVLDFTAGPGAPRGQCFVEEGSVLSLAIDRAGHWWLGTDRSGLLRVVREVGSLWAAPRPVRCRTVAEYGGRTFVGTLGGGLREVRQGVLESRGPDASAGMDYVSALTSGEDGLWIGGEYRLMWLGPDADARPEPIASVPEDIIFALARGPGGVLHAGTRGGQLLRLDPAARKLVPAAERLRSVIVGLTAGGDGLWVAAQSGLFRLEGDRLVRPEDPLLRDAGARCVASGKDGTVFAGLAGGGLAVISGGRTTVINEQNGLEVHVINQIIEDREGDLWLGTLRGIARLSGGEVRACLQKSATVIHPVTYSESNGLRSEVCSWAGSPSAALLADGRLAFPTDDGVTVIDPSLPPPLQQSPRAFFRGVEVDGAFHPVTREFDFSSRRRPLALRLHYEAVDVEHPGDAFFRWRVDPAGPGWIAVGEQRVVTYLNPPPGRQTIHLQVRNRNGQWNDAPPLVLVFRPHWWELTSVRIAAVCLLAGLPLLALRLRYAATEKQRALASHADRRVHAERSRIARDLHDDIGNRLSEIQLLAEGLGSTLSHHERLDRLHQRTVGAVEALDELVWMLNPRNDTWPSVLRLLEKEAASHLDAAGIACQFRVSEPTPTAPLHPALRHALVLAFREILHNAVRHAAPHLVEVLVAFSSEEVTLRVVDDGRGFDEAAARQLGRGLHGVETRAQELGGSLHICSGAGHTETRLTLPLVAAGETSLA